MSAVLNSGRLKKTTTKVSKHDFPFVINTLFNLGKAKAYLEIAICELFGQVFKRDLLDKRACAKLLLPRLLEETPKDGKQSLFMLFLHILLRNETPKLQKIDYLQDNKHEELKELVKVCKFQCPFTTSQLTFVHSLAKHFFPPERPSGRP